MGEDGKAEARRDEGTEARREGGAEGHAGRLDPIAAALFRDPFWFIGPNGVRGCCTLCVYQLRDSQILVIWSERSDNPGMSVTNAAETLAELVANELQLAPGLVVWVEHWPASLRPTIPRSGQACWHQVEFNYVRETRSFDQRRNVSRYADPAWREMTEADWVKLGVDARTFYREAL